MGYNYQEKNLAVIRTLDHFRKDRDDIKQRDKADILKRKENKNPLDEELCTEIELKNCDWDSDPAKFTKRLYAFCNISASKFGEKAVLREEKMYQTKANFWGVIFDNCIFENIYFNACTFWNCTFKNCKFEGLSVIFEKCNFSKTELILQGKEFVTYDGSTEFENCELSSSKFYNCSGSRLIFDNNRFILSSFNNCNMPEVIMKDNYFYSTYFNNSNIKDLCIIGIKKADLEFHFTNESKNIYMHKNIYVSKMEKEHLQNKEDFEFASKMYYTLIDYLGMKNMDTEYMSEYKYCYNYFSMNAKARWKQPWDRFSWIVCGFGEKLGRFIAFFLAAIIIPAFGYLLCGIQLGKEIIKYTIVGNDPFTLGDWLRDFGKCLHFSIVTFSTVGYGNIVPINGSYIISAIQILVGILFIALFTSIVLKKILK